MALQPEEPQEPPLHLSAKAGRNDGAPLTPEELAAAEDEALAWAPLA